MTQDKEDRNEGSQTHKHHHVAIDPQTVDSLKMRGDIHRES